MQPFIRITICTKYKVPTEIEKKYNWHNWQKVETCTFVKLEISPQTAKSKKKLMEKLVNRSLVNFFIFCKVHTAAGRRKLIWLATVLARASKSRGHKTVLNKIKLNVWIETGPVFMVQ
jgi:hypothetical protein